MSIRDRTDAARPTSAAHHRARSHGLAKASGYNWRTPVEADISRYKPGGGLRGSFGYDRCLIVIVFVVAGASRGFGETRLHEVVLRVSVLALIVRRDGFAFGGKFRLAASQSPAGTQIPRFC